MTKWDLIVAGPARRSIDRIPAKVAVAVFDFLIGPLIEKPDRVGKPLGGELVGLHSARVGAYRIVYEISEDDSTMPVLYIDNRADVYRPR